MANETPPPASAGRSLPSPSRGRVREGAIKVALAQINPTVGDIAGNAGKILACRAQAKDADLVVFPELSLIGYPPEDLVLSSAFRARAMQEIQALAKETAHGPALLVGSLWEEGGYAYNTALLLAEGKILHRQPKRVLPNYGIFDEKRIFSPGAASKPVSFGGVSLGILVCEDAWTPDVALELKKQGAQLLITINASPFEAGKLAHRKSVMAATAKVTELPLIYVNMVGGQDDIVFDGGSFALSASGEVTSQLPEFAEKLVTLSEAEGSFRSLNSRDDILSTEASLWSAMKLGLADYLRKNGFSGVVLGLSGGIDSALSAVAAVDALGAANVHGVLLPSPYTAKESVEDAQALTGNLGIQTTTLPITPGMQVMDEVLSPVFRDAAWMEDVAVGGNLQARLRGLMLMAMSNKFGWMLLATGNKSEIAVGYSTLYGDSCGGYNLLKDIYKTQVYTLAHWRNRQGAVIPERSLTRAPTAELAPGQTDQDQLPPYDLLDRILYHHIEERRGTDEIVSLGFDQKIVGKVVRMVRQSEYKRRQSAPGVKLSPMLFSRDRRYPLTNKF